MGFADKVNAFMPTGTVSVGKKVFFSLKLVLLFVGPTDFSDHEC